MDNKYWGSRRTVNNSDYDKNLKWDIADGPPTENPIQALRCAMSSYPGDWSVDKRMSWMYGIICGWDNASYVQLQQKHNWSDEDVARNIRLRDEFYSHWPKNK